MDITSIKRKINKYIIVAKNLINKNFIKSYILYVLRWIIAAIPGAMFFEFIATNISGIYIPMIISQAILGIIFFWIDRKILSDTKF